MMQRAFVVLLILLSPWVPSTSWAAKKPIAPPKLVLVLAVDQLRADTFGKFQSRFLPVQKGTTVGGFSYLMSGAYYPLGEYDTFQCMTGPGHATILTGSHPYTNGIAQNMWFDQKAQKPVYCVQDDSTPIVGTDQPKKRTGSTPKTLLGSTVGDELKNSGYSSRVVTIALKDRSAILMGGHRADLALWHDSNAMKWVSSRKYLPDGKLPAWVEELNAAITTDAGKQGTWKAEKAGTGVSSQKNEVNEKHLWGMKPGFPHEFNLRSQYALRAPYGVNLTLEASLKALTTLKLGSGKHPDLLAVSFSTHDYVAHAWGPNSREAEEITLAEDRAISKLLNEVQKAVPGGLSNVTIVLTADHGGSQIPEHLLAAGVPAGRIPEADLGKLAAEKIAAELGKAPEGESWVPFVADMAFYLNRPALEKKGKDAYARAEAILKLTLAEHPGTHFAIGFTDWLVRTPPPGEVGRRFMLTYFPGRSGDVILLPKPNWISDADSAGHMTPWAYDRYVPILFKGPHFNPGRYAQSAKVVDIAPTLSFILGVTPPSLSEGRVLHEALR